MKFIYDFFPKVSLAFFVLMLSLGSLQAQSQPNCDLSKCSPEERAECAKKCTTNSTYSVASLTNFLFGETNLEKANCKPVGCKKVEVAQAKLVNTQTKTAAVYSSNLETAVIKDVKKKEKCCATKCKKAKTSL